MRRLAYLLALVTLLGVAGCDKGATKPAEAADVPENEAPHPPLATPAAAKSTPTPAPKRPAGPEPKLPDVVLKGLTLEGDERARFFALLESAPSPCGKAHSLRVSIEQDAACKRSPHAARWIARLVAVGADDEEVLGRYGKRYLVQGPLPTFDLKGVAHVGDPAAKIVIVEFFDYGCPHCKLMAPLVEQVAEAHKKDVVVYFMNFPLGHWATSEPAARAAIAADRQGKFAAFHLALFAAQGKQDEETLHKIAKDLGLDAKKFDADRQDQAVAAMVIAQHDQGVKAQLSQTPTIYLNVRQYLGAPDIAWLNEAIDEEAAVLHE